MCRRQRGAGWFGSCADALDAVTGEVVLISTPARFELAFVALAVDRHVIVAPPAFACAAQGELLRDGARAAGRCVFVAASAPYRPLADALRRIVSRGTLGEIRLLQINALHARSGFGRADGGTQDERLFADALNWISLLASLGMPIVRVASQGGRRGPTRVLTIEYVNGAIGVLSHSLEIPSPLRRLRLSAIHGTAGAALFETGGLFLLEAGRRRRILLSALEDVRGRRAMLRDFLQVLRTGGSPRYTLEHARRDVALLEAVTPRPT